MDRRKADILNAIISSYILDPIPVGSRTLSKDYELGVSSATIRNEMADLEDLGYLNKPHQSAGRIPSYKAYRFFVDEVFSSDKLAYDGEIISKLKYKILEGSINDGQIFRTAVKILADVSNCTAYIVAPKKADTTIKKIILMKIETNLFLLLIIGNKGVVERYIINLPLEISDEELDELEQIISRQVRGVDFNKIDELNITLKGTMVSYKFLIAEIFNRLKKFNNRVSAVDIYYDGLTNIFNFEEYRDPTKAKEFMSFIEDRESLIDILSSKNFSKNLEVVIGNENRADLMKTNSIIRAVFVNGNNLNGSLGLIGPVRMDYKKLIKVVNIFKDAVEEVLEEM